MGRTSKILRAEPARTEITDTVDLRDRTLVACHVEILGVPYAPTDPYWFCVCPRQGEHIGLPIHGKDQELTRFVVDSVLHVPNGADRDKPAFVVLFVKSLSA
jgi:hypothetical protein